MKALFVAASLALAGCADATEFERIEQSISAILELPTVEYHYRDIIYFGRSESFLFIPTVDKRLLFGVDLTVRAGYDLSRGLRLGRDADGRLSVSLPPARILMIDADETSIREYFTVERGQRIERLEYIDEINRVKPLIAEDAVRRGILVRARENAVRLVNALLAAEGYDQAAVSERESEGP